MIETQSFPYLEDLLPNGQAMDMVFVKGGRYNRGSNEYEREQPIHEVTVPDFYIGKNPVTVKEYLHFVNETDSNQPEWMEEGNQYNIYTGTDEYYKRMASAITEESHPIIGVSWHNAVAYCDWLSNLTKKKYRLPSEAEWEYAARGGQESKGFRYAGGDNLKEVGWFSENSHSETKPVGLKQPNELGIFDMSGNVWEWCMDHWHENYEGGPTDGRPWLNEGEDINHPRVLRGGSWDGSNGNCRVSDRDGVSADFRFSDVGFRISRY
jgi:formylglycine-generating enzyme required for sulfatase activity